jgi:hypothetical protein
VCSKGVFDIISDFTFRATSKEQTDATIQYNQKVDVINLLFINSYDALIARKKFNKYFIARKMIDTFQKVCTAYFILFNCCLLSRANLSIGQKPRFVKIKNINKFKFFFTFILFKTNGNGDAPLPLPPAPAGQAEHEGVHEQQHQPHQDPFHLQFQQQQVRKIYSKC